jgi:hypothetical protein
LFAPPRGRARAADLVADSAPRAAPVLTSREPCCDVAALPSFAESAADFSRSASTARRAPSVSPVSSWARARRPELLLNGPDRTRSGDRRERPACPPPRARGSELDAGHRGAVAFRTRRESEPTSGTVGSSVPRRTRKSATRASTRGDRRRRRAPDRRARTCGGGLAARPGRPGRRAPGSASDEDGAHGCLRRCRSEGA